MAAGRRPRPFGEPAGLLGRAGSAGDLALWLTGSVLSLTGFEPNVEQTETALLGIRFLAGVVPLVFFTLSLLLVVRFGLDEAAHRALRARLRG